MTQASALGRYPTLLLAVALVALAAFLVDVTPHVAQAQSTVKVGFGYDLDDPEFPYNLSVDEGVGTVRVPVTVDVLPQSSLVVAVNASTITAEGGKDYTFAAQKTLTFRATDSAKTQFVEFTVTDDATQEDQEYLHLTLSLPRAPEGVSVVASRRWPFEGLAFVAIVDNDLSATPAGGQYAITPSVTAEEGGAATLTVTLGRNAPAGGLTFTVTPRYVICGPTDLACSATEADVGTVPSTLVVPSGSRSATLSIPIAADREEEADEHFSVNIATGAAGWSPVPWGNQGTVIIANVASSNANLRGLTATGATGATATFRALTLSPAFDADTTAYTATAPYSVTHAGLTPTVEDSGRATVTVAGRAVTSGTASRAIALDVGSNAIAVRVTAEDSTTRDYTVTITRQPTHWSATLTAKDLGWAFGCGLRSVDPQCDDGLTNDVITYEGVDYEVESVAVPYSGGTLQLILDQAIPASLRTGLRLNVDNRQFHVSDATIRVGAFGNEAAWVLSWTGTGLSWSEDESVSLSLVTPVGGL